MIGAITAGLFSTGTAASTNSYESIATVTVGSGGSSSISFSSIPSTYKHLQIRVMGICVGGATINGVMNFNSDTTGTNYYSHWLTGNGTAASASAANYPYLPLFTGGSTAPSGYVIDILDYANTNKNKTTRALGGYDANGSGSVVLNSALWSNTAAINSITFTTNGGNWAQYSSFALYGIK